MAAEKMKTGTVAALLGLAYLLLRGDSAHAADAGPEERAASSSGGRSGGSRAAKTGGGTSTIVTVANAGKTAAGLVSAGAAGAKALGLSASGAGVVGAAVVLEAAGIYTGYQLDGTRGAIIGGINPIVGNSATLGGKAGKAVAHAVGTNDVGTGAAEGSGYVLGALCGLGELAAAAALLPTIGLVVALADLVGAILGIGNSDGPPPDPTPQEHVNAAVAIAMSNRPELAVFHITTEDRINAAAQLVAWANGPDTVSATFGAFGSTTQPNPYKTPARLAVGQLGTANGLLNRDARYLLSGNAIGVPVHHS